MDPKTERFLAAFGFDQVIVALRRSGEGGIATVAKRPPSEVTENFLEEIPRGVSARTAYGKETPVSSYFPRLGFCVGYVDRQGAQALDANQEEVGRVHHLEQIELIRPKVRMALKKIRKGLTWGLKLLGLRTLWETGVTGEGVRVGHLDTGVDARHVALRGKVKAFMEFDYLGNRMPNSRPHDPDGHGTHTAGTVCGGAVKGVTIGVAPGVDLYSGLVIEGGNAALRVLNGMEWCIENEVRVLSMSLGFPEYTPFFEAVMESLRANGVLPVIAIGNEGPGTSRSPGNYPSALSVGAVDRQKRVASFSSSITFARRDDPIQPNVVAPGVDVVSSVPHGLLETMSGTSMATPHVAGVVALLLGGKRDSSIDVVEQAIQKTCDPLPQDPMERWGYGLVNAVKAAEAFLGKA